MVWREIERLFECYEGECCSCYSSLVVLYFESRMVVTSVEGLTSVGGSTIAEL
jgi:hypothetical protein